MDGALYMARMRVLYHLWLCPFSRKVRVVLGEKRLECELRIEKVWERRDAFLALNPRGQIPVLVEDDGHILADSRSISEYLDEVVAEPPLTGGDPHTRAEARRLTAWFDEKFHAEVTVNLVDEKITKRMLGLGEPLSAAVRAGSENIHIHLSYVEWLIERRSWLAGETLTIADIAAAAHLSAVDYLGDVPWEDHPGAKDWYARIKSRPSFRSVLGDHIPGAPPPKHYADLDF